MLLPMAFVLCALVVSIVPFVDAGCDECEPCEEAPMVPDAIWTTKCSCNDGHECIDKSPDPIDCESDGIKGVQRRYCHKAAGKKTCEQCDACQRRPMHPDSTWETECACPDGHECISGIPEDCQEGGGSKKRKKGGAERRFCHPVGKR